MSAISSIVAQQAVQQLGAATAMVKQAHQADQAIVNMVAASVESTRGQNLNILV